MNGCSKFKITGIKQNLSKKMCYLLARYLKLDLFVKIVIHSNF